MSIITGKVADGEVCIHPRVEAFSQGSIKGEELKKRQGDGRMDRRRLKQKQRSQCFG